MRLGRALELLSPRRGVRLVAVVPPPQGKPARLTISRGAAPAPREALAELIAALEHDGYIAGARTHQALADARAALTDDGGSA